MNRNFGKLTDGKLTYAPDHIRIGDVGIWNPTDQHYVEAGWLRVHDIKPTDRDGVYYIPDGWEARDDAIYRTYHEESLVHPNPPVIRYSKLKLIIASKAAGKWEAFKAFIVSAGYEDEWQACQFLSSGYEQFEQAKVAIIAAGIATTEEIEAILSASVDEEVA